MSRITKCFESLKTKGQSALIPFITAGDPHPKHTVEMMHTLVKSGSDIIELGVPFSDPMADGPVIQAADERALAHNVSLNDVMGMVAEFRKKDSNTPIVLMGYLNPIEIMGYEKFAQSAQASGVDALIIVDLPPEESQNLIKITAQHEIDVIYLISPTTRKERIKVIAEAASGYLYYVSLKGVTGANTLDVNSVKAKLAEIRAISDLPISVGFGIKEGATAKAVAAIAEGVVVGSVLVNKIAASTDNVDKIHKGLSDVLTDMRTQMNEVPS